MRRAVASLIVTALLQVPQAGVRAQGGPEDPLAPLDRFAGAWTGAGTLHGSKSLLELRFDRVLGRRFVRVEHRNRVETPGGELLFEGLAVYRAVGGTFTATWFDSFGHVYPVAASLEGDTLRAEWGTPDTEQGLTLYRLTAPHTLEVRDSVRKAGTFQELGRATLARR